MLTCNGYFSENIRVATSQTFKKRFNFTSMYEIAARLWLLRDFIRITLLYPGPPLSNNSKTFLKVPLLPNSLGLLVNK